MRWLLNSAVIAVGGDGTYHYRTISKNQAIAWLQDGEFESRIGYLETAQFIEAMSGVAVPLSREASAMRAGDEALIVRLKYRVRNPGDKGVLNPSPDDWDFAILSRPF